MAIVTENSKYINWPYETSEMKRTEELYNMKSDRLELNNLVGKQSAAADLERMRTLYDKAVKHWKNNAVGYHNYQDLGDWFSRK